MIYMYSNRPKLDLPPNPTDRLLQQLVWTGVAVCWVYAFFSYRRLPATIPLHYNIHGEIDGYGSKMMLWLLPVLLTFIIGFMSWLNKYPHWFNYPVTITTENAEQHYRAGVRLLTGVQLAVVVIFLVILHSIIPDAHTGESSLHGWVIPLVIALPLLPVAIYFREIFRKNQS